jgi:hypothetical protein
MGAVDTTAAFGREPWAIADGFIASHTSFEDRALALHEIACILVPNAKDAHVVIRIFLSIAVGPYRVTVSARRTLYLRFNDLAEPDPVPRNTEISSVFETDVPVVAQHPRLDSRHIEISPLSITVYSHS